MVAPVDGAQLVDCVGAAPPVEPAPPLSVDPLEEFLAAVVLLALLLVLVPPAVDNLGVAPVDCPLGAGEYFIPAPEEVLGPASMAL